MLSTLLTTKLLRNPAVILAPKKTQTSTLWPYLSPVQQGNTRSIFSNLRINKPHMKLSNLVKILYVYIPWQFSWKNGVCGAV